MNARYFLILFIGALAISCSSLEDIPLSVVDIKIQSINVKKVNVDVSNTSGTGFSGIWNGAMYFFDGVTSYLYRIDKDGSLKDRQLGFGRGPMEIPTRNIDEVCVNPLDNNLDILADIVSFEYDGSNPVNMYTMKYVGKDKSYSSALAYTTWNEVILRSYGNNLYYNILGSSESIPMLNPDYFSSAAIIMCDHLKTGRMEPLGRYSDYYRENFKKIKHLPYIYFDLDEKGNIITSFQADPYIYKYGRNHEVSEVFGVAGKDINANYTNSGSSAKQFETAYQKDILHSGYYYWLECEGDYIFRSYQKSDAESNDGLQIFEGSTLIGDVDVPKHFKVAGTIGEEYVTRLYIDDETGEAYYYTFTFNRI